ncbi:MAG: PAS domain S-box protein [Hyphomicrobiales bacterium]|nr:PAS domain S-box protein [Hyphomicrobiales bacterium]
MTTRTPEHDPLANARLAAIVDSSYDAIIGKELNGIITNWNRAAERLFGYTAEEAIGQSVLMLIPDSLQSEEADIISRVRRGEQVASFETTRRRKDGTYVAVSLTISPIRAADGSIIGASKIARDISVAKDNERRIRLLMREVNHRVKNQFAVILSVIRETSRRATDPNQFEEQVRDRIMALSRSHDLLVNSEWAGASLLDLLQEHLKPFGHESQISLSGPLVTLQPTAVQHLGMAFHELGTNASKFGALSTDAGQVQIEWHIATSPEGRREFHVVWNETSVPAALADRDAVDTRRGFGSVVLQRVAPQSLSGTAVLDRWPGHVRWSLTAPAETTLVLPLGEQNLTV